MKNNNKIITIISFAIITILSAQSFTIDETFAYKYDREEWGNWKTIGGCNLRNRLLIKYGTSVRKSGKCKVISGTWIGTFSGTRITSPRQVHIDHIVSLKEAHVSGGYNWPRSRKRQFYNDELNLVITYSKENIRKSSKDLRTYVPKKNLCLFASRYIAVKKRYGLIYDTRELPYKDLYKQRCNIR